MVLPGGDSGASLRSRLINGGLGVGALKVLSLVLGLSVSIVLARSLGPAGFGQYSFVLSIVLVSAIPLDHGVRHLTTRETARFSHGQHWGLLLGLYKRLHQWILVGGVGAAAFVASIAMNGATWRIDDRWTLLCVGAVALPMLGLTGLRAAFLRGLGHIVEAQIPEFAVRRSVQLLMAISLTRFNLLNPLAAVGSYVVAVAVDFLVCTVLLRRRWPSHIRLFPPKLESRAWMRAWIALTMIELTGALNGEIGILMLGLWGTDEQVAALRVAGRGAELVAMSLAVVTIVIGPYIARAYRDDDRLKLQKLYRRSAQIGLVIAIPIAFPLIVFGEYLIPFVFGEGYGVSTANALALLAGAQLINVGFGALAIVLVMTGFERDTLVAQSMGLVVNMVGCVFLIPIAGVEGAALAASSAIVAWNVLLAVSVYRRLKLRPGPV
jgi:O-antigen/teichoic acid export membrane protein